MKIIAGIWTIAVMTLLSCTVDGYLYEDDLEVPASSKQMTLTFREPGDKTIDLAGTGTAIIDWGDGSANETKTLTSTSTSYTHSYFGTTARIITIKGDNVTLLVCAENQLTGLNVSENTALKTLECNDNQLTSLDAGKNVALEELYCAKNQLPNLDISKNTALTILECSVNLLTSLDVSKNTALKELYCWDNELTSLDVSKNTALTELDCEYNLLTAAGLNALFGTLHGNTVAGGKTVLIAGNPGTSSCNRALATAKGWTVEPPVSGNVLPALTTNAVTDFTATTATLGGYITDAGTPGYTERGVVYATSTNPTTADKKTEVTGTGTGNYTASVTGLNAGTTYYVRAYAINSQGTAYGNQVSFKTDNMIYTLDDGTAEDGWRANSTNTGNYWMGNQFTVGESGELTSIDVYGQNSTDNKNSPVYIDIYDQSKALVGSSASFILPSNAWINVTVNNLSYSGTFYVMVRWPAGSTTHYLGIDSNGSKAQANLNWTRNNSGEWNLVHTIQPDDPDARGVFLIRAKAKTTTAKSVTYGTDPQPEVSRTSAGTAAGTAECSSWKTEKKK